MYKISYVSDGLTTEFAFAFPFFQAADVRVAINDIVGDSNYNYTVMPNSDFTGGNVVFDVAPPADTKLDIFRQISLSRTIDYQPTHRIDPEDLNTDFNFLLSAFQDLHSVNIDLTEWANIHDDVKSLINYTHDVIGDKLGGGAVLGLYRNLLGVLENALPKLINDYGSITEPAPNENRDDYGVL
ncbi:MAG: hypothetical protein E7008_01855 [Alphaproteobacteria bacterium]|nr:hypothetical protein [Alphaproteobacteria bacterium]